MSDAVSKGGGNVRQPLHTRIRVSHERQAKAWRHETTVEIEHPVPVMGTPHGDMTPAGMLEDLDAAMLLRLQFLMQDVDRVAQSETERRNRRDFADAYPSH